jgi:dipeptidyl aminopeptidase/acylaminoacyl peptidase
MIRATVFAASLAAAAIRAAAAEPPAIESFFRLPQYARMALSPDGKRIAALAPVGGRQGLVVIDVDHRNATPIAAAQGFDVVDVHWINSRRMYYRFATLGERDEDAQFGVWLAIDIDGTNRRELPYYIERTLPGETDDIIVRARLRGFVELFRLNSRTGARESLSIGKPDGGRFESWVVDSKGVPRVFTVYDLASVRVWYRAATDAPWTKIDEHPTRAHDGLNVVALSEDDRSLYVNGRAKGRDVATIVRYDPQKKALGDIVAQHPQVDLHAAVADAEAIRGVAYDADRPGVAWFDETLAGIQGTIDKAMPGRVNTLSWSTDRQRVLVRSQSDVEPGSFYLLDRKTGTLEWLADTRPWIDPKQMSPMRPVRIRARDGKEIPAYLTVPRGSSGKNLPLVVVVHGGPWVDGDSWRWNPEVQFLASRGYAVLQPNYRGTTRYGWEYFSSSFGQWGLAMQDDVEDALRWAIAEGVADPQRVCIYGASYGGYAALMGAAKTPDLYKCAIDYVGVTDLPLLLSASWSDTWHSQFAVQTTKYQIGDPDKDAERLKATSPTSLASRINAAVMMAYGAADVRVVPEHGTMMKAALERAGKPPEVWMMVDGEGHGFRRLDNEVKFYGEMEKFLNRHIGPQ